MKPLLSSQIAPFLKRFENFQDAEIQDIEIISATSIQIKLFLQDSQREFNWIDLYLLFEGVSDAKLPQPSQINFIDSSEGFTLFYENGDFFFSCEKDKSLIGTQNALCYIIAKSIKTKEEVQS